MAGLRLENLAKRFGAIVVADELSIDIGDGEFFVFLGPSGSGKSTLLHIIGGIEAPDAGRVWIGDADVTALAPQKRDVAMVFQSYALYPHLSVFENLAFPLRTRGVRGTAVRGAVQPVAESLGIATLLERKPRQLSGGQRQRIALGRALVRRPAAFLMDEPLSNLDAALRLEIREEIKRIHQTHAITTAYVTHDQEEAMALADRIAVLHQGRIQQCDTPARLYARPQNAFVAQFIGSPPMVLVPAAALATHPGLRSRLAGRDPSAVKVGLRPQTLTAWARPSTDALDFEVDIVEPAGEQAWVLGRVRGTRVRARLGAGEVLVPGALGYLSFAAAAAHLFDAGSGTRID
jgi:multiple sugar transport system ATP-binding protein